MHDLHPERRSSPNGPMSNIGSRALAPPFHIRPELLFLCHDHRSKFRPQNTVLSYPIQYRVPHEDVARGTCTGTIEHPMKVATRNPESVVDLHCGAVLSYPVFRVLTVYPYDIHLIVAIPQSEMFCEVFQCFFGCDGKATAI